MATVKPARELAVETASWPRNELDLELERAQPPWRAPRHYLRASEAGDPCSRSLSLSAMGHNVFVSARTMRIFRLGRALERENVRALRRLGLTAPLPWPEPRYDDPPLVGHVDVVVRRANGALIIGEIKSIKHERFERLPPEHAALPLGQSPLLAQYPRYVTQLNVYLGAPNSPSRQGFFLFEDKNDGRQLMYGATFDRELLERTLTVLRQAVPYMVETAQRVAPVPPERRPYDWTRDPVCARCPRRYLCTRLPAQGASYAETRAVDARLRSTGAVA